MATLDTIQLANRFVRNLERVPGKLVSPSGIAALHEVKDALEEFWTVEKTHYVDFEERARDLADSVEDVQNILYKYSIDPTMYENIDLEFTRVRRLLTAVDDVFANQDLTVEGVFERLRDARIEFDEEA